MNEQEIKEKEQEARALGSQHGHAAGSWVFDGNSSEESIRRVLQGIEDGDPEIMDMQPAPLSGEWADDSTPASVLTELGVPEDDDAADDLLTEYEQGFSDGYWDEVQTFGQDLLGEKEQGR